MTAPRVFDRDLLVARRTRIAATAAAHDFLLRRAADDLVERLEIVNRRFEVALDLGSHHGVLAEALSQIRGIPLVVALDDTEPLLRKAPSPKVLADPEALPFRADAFDLVVSALTLHHVNDLPGTLAQVFQLLKPDGLMLATLLGGRTLSELREVMVEAELEADGGVSPRVAPFADIRDLGGLLQRAGFALPAVDADLVTVTFSSALAFLAEVRGMGCGNVLVERRRMPMSRALLGRVLDLYHARHGGPDGRVRATFELVTMTGWTPHATQQRPLKPGSAQVSLLDALRGRRTD
jgi:SAM-dependent methyltransferase